MELVSRVFINTLRVWLSDNSFMTDYQESTIPVVSVVVSHIDDVRSKVDFMTADHQVVRSEEINLDFGSAVFYASMIDGVPVFISVDEVTPQWKSSAVVNRGKIHLSLVPNTTDKPQLH